MTNLKISREVRNCLIINFGGRAVNSNMKFESDGRERVTKRIRIEVEMDDEM